MKKTILLLSMVGCLVLPALSHADTPAAKKNASRSNASMTTTKVSQTRTIYYISPETRAGSHIPMVTRAYGGRYDNAASPAVYGSNAIRSTGSLDVGTVLNKLDPSITLSRGR